MRLRSRPSSRASRNPFVADRVPLFLLATLFHLVTGLAALLPEASAADPEPVSYHRQVLPLFQAHCQGCHQPARPGGQYVMTSFDQLLKGGESGEAAVVASQPDASPLIRMLTPDESGKAEMPKGKPALSKPDRDLITRWIAEGARNDSPASLQRQYSLEHPPAYTRLPVISSLDVSPDGTLLAVAGFHEVLLHKTDGHGLAARLIGLSERIESVRFSPDGSRLAVAGGLPGRTGELQVWSLGDKTQANMKLDLSIPLTFDTIYGVSWSPDGTQVAVGCSDKSVRGFDVASGNQIFFNGAHEDWAVDTVYGVDGKLLVSIGRDMSAKLYEVETQRFVDNITSITPGALKGGLQAIARHPKHNVIAVGGSDGVARLYQMERNTARVIGDDANLLRRFPAVKGRIFSIDFSADGEWIAVGSSLDGKGSVSLFQSNVAPTLPEEIRPIVSKVASTQNAEERKTLEEFLTTDSAPKWTIDLPTSIYAVNVTPDQTALFVAGGDGQIRIMRLTDGYVQKTFPVIEVQAASEAETQPAARPVASQTPTVNSEESPTESAPAQGSIARLFTQPEAIHLTGPREYIQLIVMAELANGDRVDVGRVARIDAGESPLVSVTPAGLVTPQKEGSASLTISVAGQELKLPVTVSGLQSAKTVSFIEDVNPVLTKVGCNQGTCHGSKDGKNGFKLSLRGYDALFDLRSFTDDHASRRVNVASPDSSLMLLKATGAVPHSGGQLFKPGDEYYQIVRAWIAEGAQLDLKHTRPAKIEVSPVNPVLQTIGSRQQLRVVATWADGRQRDVTRESFLESSNTDVATATSTGLITVHRRGEAPILARYDGAYAATTITAMGDRSGFAWVEPPVWNEIDKLVANKWQRIKVLPSDLTNDYELLRRVTLDLTGLPPTTDEVRAFVSDPRETRVKRDELIDRLIGSDAFLDYWTNKWSDLLQVNGKFLGREGATKYRAWIREELANNTPYDKFAFNVLTASGSNREHPAASYYKILRDPESIMENTTHLFLAVRFNCNKCHDHPFERWTQDQYYETAAWFARVGLEADPESKDKKIGGTAVEGAVPLYELVVDKPAGEQIHLRTSQVVQPAFPFDAGELPTEKTSRREELARWITSRENPYFARSYVNRIWGYLTGVGLIEPLDDIRAGNPPSNPELLDWLTQDFIAHNFDTRHLIRTICKSRTYQLSVDTNQWNADDTQNYSHATARRLPAEVLFDTIHSVTGHPSAIPGMAPGTRAAALPDSGISTEDGFLANLGRPVRESACECERSQDLQLGPIMALMSGPTVGDAISDDKNTVASLVERYEDDATLFNELSLRILNRPASQAELVMASRLIVQLDQDQLALQQQLDDYNAKTAEAVAAANAVRDKGIATAKKNLQEHQALIQPGIDKAEKERQERITAANALLAEAEQSLRETSLAWLAKTHDEQTRWTTLPVDLAASKNTVGGTLGLEADGSVFNGPGPSAKGAYILKAGTPLRMITAVRLEAIADDRLSSRGPGRAGNGNFVLTELTISLQSPAVEGEPQTAQKKLALKNAKADFSQGGYDISTAIDGKVADQGNGWAINGGNGKSHTATFELDQPLEIPVGATFEITMQQSYSDGNHSLGRFRLSVTDNMIPVTPGLPGPLAMLADKPADELTDQEKGEVIKAYRELSPDYLQVKAMVDQANRPLPIDPMLESLKVALKVAEKPLPIDPQRARLERSIELGKAQLENRRLTIAQDYVWALINSPAFLFNH